MPCTRRSLPRLTELWDRYADLRDRFSIVAFHDDSVPDFATLDEKLAATVEKVWGGRELPFPIVLDATGTTLERFGVRGFPTTILVDPDGRIVRDGSVERLRAVLAELR